LRKWDQEGVGKVRAGAVGFLESRMAVRGPGRWATSTQLASLVLRVLLRHTIFMVVFLGSGQLAGDVGNEPG